MSYQKPKTGTLVQNITGKSAEQTKCEEANPLIGAGYNYTQHIPIPEHAPVTSAEKICFMDIFDTRERNQGDEHANKSFNGMTRSEMWTGIHKQKYIKDGTFNASTSATFTILDMNSRTTTNAPIGEDGAHPRMGHTQETMPHLWHQRPEDMEMTVSNCHRKFNRFLICGLDLSNKSAWTHCKKEFLDYKYCLIAYKKYCGNAQDTLAKQLATFSKGINDEYLDVISAAAFQYGDTYRPHHQVGQSEFTNSNKDQFNVNKVWTNRYF